MALVANWAVRYAAGRSGGAVPPIAGILPVISINPDFNWDTMQLKAFGRNPAPAAAHVFNTDYAPGFDATIELTQYSYHQWFAAHFAGGVEGNGTMIGDASTHGTVYTYNSGTSAFPNLLLNLYAVYSSGNAKNDFIGSICVPEISLSGNLTDELRFTAKCIGGYGTYNQTYTYTTNLQTGSTHRPFVPLSCVVTINDGGGGANFKGTVKEWSLTSNRNASGRKAFDGNKGFYNFTYGLHDVDLSLSADFDDSTLVRDINWNETTGTAVIEYTGSNTGDGRANFKMISYFHCDNVQYELGDPNETLSLTMKCTGVDPGLGYSLRIIGTTIGNTAGTLHQGFLV